MDLKKYIRSIPDYPKRGILFRDITTLIKNPDAFKFTNDKIIEIAKKMQFDKVAAIESRGFVFASTVSYALNKPFILLRKKNKLPAETYSVDFTLEYGDATIEVHKDSIDKGEKILVIDDLIATGGTAEAAAKLINISGGSVFGTNGFYLPMDNKSPAELDQSGNNNHFDVYSSNQSGNQTTLDKATGGIPILRTNAAGTQGGGVRTVCKNVVVTVTKNHSVEQIHTFQT